jgi:two-component system CitB family response regulator
MDKIRVVIAEDDPQIAEIQKRFLERIDGFELVGIAHGLTETADLVDILEPELLLLDVQFPTGTGLELLKEIRADDKKTDVILITADKEVDTLTQAMRGGVFDYILKPLVFERLQESLNNFAAHLAKLNDAEFIAQTDVDTLLPRQTTAPKDESEKKRLPKGIDQITLNKIMAAFAEKHASWNAEELGEHIGVSRTTARRYLEYLVSVNALEAQINYGGLGRPERRYVEM